MKHYKLTYNARMTNIQQFSNNNPHTSLSMKRAETTHNQTIKTQKETHKQPYADYKSASKEMNDDKNQYEDILAAEDEVQVQKYLQQSVHVCIQESLTLPQQDSELSHIQKELLRQSKPSETAQKINCYVPSRSKLSFKSIELKLQKFWNQVQSQQLRVSFTGYEQEYFLKIQTQIFKIDVVLKLKQYVIKRRFSQFHTLQKLIRHYYPGYILYPFPEKSMQFFKKLRLSIGSEQQKVIIIEKRLFELQRYLNFLVSHREIATSVILQIFLEESSEIFQKETNNLLSIMQQQEKEVQVGGVIEQNYNSIKKLMKSGFSFINSYLVTPEQANSSQQNLKDLQMKSREKNQLFDTIFLQLQECIQKLSNFAANINTLTTIYKQNSQISNIQSSIDSVLKLSSKMSSSRSFSQKFAEWIQENLIYHIKYYQVLLRTIRQSIGYRSQLVQKMQSLTVQQFQSATKIQEKIHLFEERFIKDWSDLMREFDHNLAILYQQFNAQWKVHCTLMAKIWK